jgi:hypothetical protein
MARINVGRLILSGIVTGIIVDIVEDVANGWLLGQQWNDALTALNRPPFTPTHLILFNIWGLIVGLATIWIYAGFRPRFGAGPRTAVYAALTTWVLAYFLCYLVLAMVGMPTGLMVTVAIIGLVEIIVAALIGMHLYREDA